MLERAAVRRGSLLHLPISRPSCSSPRACTSKLSPLSPAGNTCAHKGTIDTIDTLSSRSSHDRKPLTRSAITSISNVSLCAAHPQRDAGSRLGFEPVADLAACEVGALTARQRRVVGGEHHAAASQTYRRVVQALTDREFLVAKCSRCMNTGSPDVPCSLKLRSAKGQMHASTEHTAGYIT